MSPLERVRGLVCYRYLGAIPKPSGNARNAGCTARGPCHQSPHSACVPWFERTPAQLRPADVGQAGPCGVHDGAGASPNPSYLVSIFSRGAHRASGTGEPHGALETVSASWALWTLLALERRGDDCSKAAPSREHPASSSSPGQSPQAGSGRFLGRDRPPGPHGSARCAGAALSPVLYHCSPRTSVVNPHPSWEGLLSPRWATEARSYSGARIQTRATRFPGLCVRSPKSVARASELQLWPTCSLSRFSTNTTPHAP